MVVRFVHTGGDTYLYTSLFRFNYAYRDGGATRTGIYSTTTVEDCIFENNTAREWGGALYNWPGELTVNNCTIANNTAGTKGAAMITSGPLEVTNSIITNNYGETGVIYIDEETPAIPSRVIFDNNYIVNNYPENNKIFVIEKSTANLIAFAYSNLSVCIALTSRTSGSSCDAFTNAQYAGFAP